ncbi:MAG: prepilin-type N-terminal cleavage/methylation domain-containing protein [Magnetococcales bacterium]|nr:prepilin-type N-terminal cleavage/methylation domain-containing protein [Magnetococcales bacterium]
MKALKKKQAGFTMIELVVVMVVLGIFSAAGIGAYMNYTTNATAAVADSQAGVNNRSDATVGTDSVMALAPAAGTGSGATPTMGTAGTAAGVTN